MGARNRVGNIVVPGRQATQPGGIGSLDSILGLLKSFKIRALIFLQRLLGAQKNIPMHVCKIWVSGLASAANLCITCLSLRVPEYHSKIIGFTRRIHRLPSIAHTKLISLVVTFQIIQVLSELFTGCRTLPTTNLFSSCCILKLQALSLGFTGRRALHTTNLFSSCYVPKLQVLPAGYTGYRALPTTNLFKLLHSKIIVFICRIHRLLSITHNKLVLQLVKLFIEINRFKKSCCIPKLQVLPAGSQVAEHYPQQTYSLVVTFQNYRFYLQDSQVAEHYPLQTYSLVVPFQNYRFYPQDSQVAEHYPQQTYLQLLHSKIVGFTCRIHRLPSITHNKLILQLLHSKIAGFTFRIHRLPSITHNKLIL